MTRKKQIQNVKRWKKKYKITKMKKCENQRKIIYTTEKYKKHKKYKIEKIK